VFTIKHICVYSSQPECHPSLSTSVQTQTNKHKNKHKDCHFWVCISHQTALLHSMYSHRVSVSLSLPLSFSTSQIICNIFFITPFFLCAFSSESYNFTVAWHQDPPFFPSLFWTVPVKSPDMIANLVTKELKERIGESSFNLVDA